MYRCCHRTLGGADRRSPTDFRLARCSAFRSIVGIRTFASRVVSGNSRLGSFMTIFDLLEMRAVQRIVSWMRRSQNLWTERTSVAKPQLVTVRDEADQARFIVERILEYRESGTLLKEQAVLFRTSSHSGPLKSN